MISGESKMGVVHPSLFSLTSQRPSVPLTMVSFWAGCRIWARVGPDQYWWGVKSPVHGRSLMVCTGLTILSTPFNTYMKLLDEIIHHHKMRYYQYADETQLYIS